jgi:Uma2 family endonuclease
MVIAPVKTKPDEHEKERAASLVLDTHWTEEGYLALSGLNRLIELSEGRLTVHDMPTPEHQRIVRQISLLLEDWVQEHNGEVLFAPMPIRLWPGKFREPDVMIFRGDHRHRIGEQFGGVPDLVVEVLSPTTQHLDRGIKFAEYAMAGVGEYWLVDPETQTIEVFALRDDHFILTGQFGLGQTAQSAQFPSCRMPIDRVFRR